MDDDNRDSDVPGAMSSDVPMFANLSSDAEQLEDGSSRVDPLSSGQSGPQRRGDLAANSQRVRVNLQSVPGSDIGADDEVIWGTKINVPSITRNIRKFIIECEINGHQLYIELLHECLLNQTCNINLDTDHVLRLDAELYKNLITYPQEVVPLFDQCFNSIASETYKEELEKVMSVNGDNPDCITIRPFNLHIKQALRELEPKHIDQLVATSGMVIRVSPIIPDMQQAFFKCVECGHEQQEFVQEGRINEPQTCANPQCRAKSTYQVIYHRCEFNDRQLVKVQEAPESIPEGETPHTVDVFCHDAMVDFCKPGDRVEVTGVYRCRSVRSDPKRKKLEAVYSTYLDAVHIQKRKKSSFTVKADQDEEYSQFQQSDDTTNEISKKMEKLAAMGKDPKIYEKLVKSFAPSIWEMEDVKKGVMCQLFGATLKNFNDASTQSSNKFRNELNVLLCGDPGTSKSQLLQYVHKVAPRGIYTSGKGSSAVGLTAYITRDPDTGDLVLESGALVLSDRGICCIDEFDKMGDASRSILHEVMEQQTVSIAKAGIIAQLNARTSILAAANPIESRYNPSKPVTENINLAPTLLSRFDLIYLILDQPNKQTDRKLAKHLCSLYWSEADRPVKPKDFIDQKTFQEYVSYSRENFHPIISDGAAKELVKAYTDMRNVGRNRGRKTISATPRNLESLIRLSESMARMHHKKIVTVEHVKEVVRLQAVATHQAATDPRTGEIDMGIINTGTSDAERFKFELICNTLSDLIKNAPNMLIKSSILLKQLNDKQLFDDDTIVSFRDLDKAYDRLEQEEQIRCDNRQADDPVVRRLT